MTEAPTTELRLLLSLREAAAALAVSQRTLWGMTEPRGTIPCVQVGKRGVRYDPEALRAWVAAQGQRRAEQ